MNSIKSPQELEIEQLNEALAKAWEDAETWKRKYNDLVLQNIKHSQELMANWVEFFLTKQA